MNREVGIYTETMAKVYADQGHWAKAAEIYYHLAAKHPERQDLANSLAEAERKMSEISQEGPERLVPLFREWIELLFQREKLDKLKRFIP
jgi:hypothetical protein